MTVQSAALVGSRKFTIDRVGREVTYYILLSRYSVGYSTSTVYYCVAVCITGFVSDCIWVVFQ